MRDFMSRARSLYAPALLSAFLLGSLAVSTEASAALFLEPFDFESSDVSVDYPDYSFNPGPGSGFVSGGELVLHSGGVGGGQVFSRPGFAMPHTLTGWVGSDPGGGHYNVALIAGGRAVLFHPGLSDGALRVEGSIGSNQDMGFTPAADVLHRVDVTSDGHGNHHVRVTDGSNPNNVFEIDYFDPTSVGDPIGFRRSGSEPPSGGPATGLFDNLQVSVPNMVYGETFANDFNLDVGVGDAASTDGVLVIQNPLAAGSTRTYGVDAPTGAFTVRADIGSDLNNGAYPIGLRISENRFVFHPGYTGIPGAFRIEGTDASHDNQDMGFVPANDVLHHFEIVADGDGNFNITVIDGEDPNNVFTTSFYNSSYVADDVSLYLRGAVTETGLFDNFQIIPDGGPRPSLHAFDNAFQTTLNGGDAGVVDGTLYLEPASSGDSLQKWDIGSPDNPGYNRIISAEIAATAAAGPDLFSVGLEIGENRIGFHPGYTGGGLFVDGPGGFGPLDVGFTPSVDQLHLLQVTQRPTGLFEVKLVNRDDPTQFFTRSFYNPNSLDGAIALYREGSVAGSGRYDNLVVQQIPEPAAAVLMLLGMLGLALRRRR